MLSRRKFIKETALIGASVPLVGPVQLFDGSEKDFTFQSAFMKVKLDNDRPSVTSLWLDSMGKGKISPNAILSLPESERRRNYKSKHGFEDKFSYWLKSQHVQTKAAWELAFDVKNISIQSNFLKANESFEILIDQKVNHTTVLGLMNERNKIILPCL